MYHLLLIEDDVELARLVSDFLQGEGYQVTSCGNALKAKKLLLAHKFDLLVCDVMLPGSSGFDLVRQVRDQFPGPILFMTAQTSVAAQLQGLALGAQDYLLKPLDPRILLAKIRVFLTPKTEDEQRAVLRCHNLSADKVSGQVLLNGQDVSLTNAELQLLLTLLQQYGVAISRERLFREQLGREYDGTDRTMDGRASRLRRKLQAIDPQWNVRVVWGQGYCISHSSLAEASDGQPQQSQPDESQPDDGQPLGSQSDDSQPDDGQPLGSQPGSPVGTAPAQHGPQTANARAEPVQPSEAAPCLKS